MDGNDLQPTAAPPRGYRVEFSPESWARLGTVPSSTFRTIREALEDLALAAARREEAGPRRNTCSPHAFEVAGFRCAYERDDARRTLILLRVLPAQETKRISTPASPPA